MQSDAAVTRSETANAADAAATSLSTSMNRKERLTAIEDEITQLEGPGGQPGGQRAAGR